jgi:hypothetical protein
MRADLACSVPLNDTCLSNSTDELFHHVQSLCRAWYKCFRPRDREGGEETRSLLLNGWNENQNKRCTDADCAHTVRGESAVLILILISLSLSVYATNQWGRYLLSYLASVPVGCESVCKHVKTIYCDTCPTHDAACEACHTCMRDKDAVTHNILPATCINSLQYGLLTGFAFAVLYSLAGVGVGRLGK